jgi:aldehyde oxidoreductase
MELTVNGQLITCSVQSDVSLLRFLRDELRLTGAKDGCDGMGHCGACTVLVDGSPQRACLVKMSDMADREVMTIESLAEKENGKLHPLQQAFIDADAVQCGFCTPGIIMAAKGLLDKNPQPKPEDIKRELSRNLCRCTGYSAILEAVQAAAQQIAQDAEYAPSSVQPERAIGTSVPRPDSIGKVTGRTLYSADLYKEDMLYGRVLWSAHPYAEILQIDTNAAEAIPGVEAVLTADDIPGINLFGAITPDQPVLAEDRVRFIGDAVALVFAETPEIAEAGLNKIKVEYKPLAGVFSPEDALKPGAPQIHEDGNVLTHLEVQTGDIETAMSNADVIMQGEYSTPFVDQGFLEPEAGLAVAGEDGGITIWTGVQNPFDIRRQVATVLGLQEEEVRMINMAVGGAFGGKCDVSLQIFLALGAQKTGRPVKMIFSRADSLRFHPKRHAFEMKYRLGATREGKLLGMEVDVVGDTGAYASWGQIVLQCIACFVCGPYFVPNVDISLKAVYTNNPPGGAWRGFGIPQVHFAVESEMDKLAHELGIDPFDIRMINGLEEGAVTHLGQVVRGSVGLKRTLESAKEMLNELKPKIHPTGRDRKIGIGLASGFKAVGFPLPMTDSAGAIIEVDPSGMVKLRVAIVDLGQGPTTALAQIAAEALDLPPDRIEVQQIDTSLSPSAGPTVSQRGIYLGGNATLGAARKLREKLISKAADLLDRAENVIEFKDGRFVDLRAEEELITLEGLAGELASQGEKLRAEYRFVETKVDKPVFPVHFNIPTKSPEDFYYNAYSYATHVAIIEVDERSGRVRTRHIIAAQDVGKAINPQIIEGQIAGSCLMGMGTALTESYQVEDGWNRTDSLAKCGLTDIRRAPDFTTIIIEDDEPTGPFGAKGVSEMAAVPTAPAITNAIYDAVGIRIYDLPATPSRVRRAIQAHQAASRSK